MSHQPPARDAALAVLVALVAVRVVALVLVIANANENPVTDVDVLRAERIATSPATPYRNFPVEYMPLQTAAIGLLGGGGAGSTATKVALVAFAADLAAAGGLLWAFGRRVTAGYLLLGLPLLGFAYLRFDLVAVALAVWALALLVREREAPSGVALGLAVMAKLWPLALAPIWVVRRQRRGLLVAAGVCVAIGGWWYLTGGPKGPFQVLSFRDARGWHTQSPMGGLQWLLGIGGTAYREADALRVGHASTLTKGLLFVGLLATEFLVWRGAGREAPAGAPLAATTALLVFSPLVSVQTALWLVPWTALASEGDREDRRAATCAAAAIALTGLLAIAWPDPTAPPGWWMKALVTARNAALVGSVAVWLWSRREAPRAAHAGAPA
ncbi:MAG TPA: glycosyltransferase family 87 protein [Actinomycetota bacterium]